MSRMRCAVVDLKVTCRVDVNIPGAPMIRTSKSIMTRNRRFMALPLYFAGWESGVQPHSIRRRASLIAYMCSLCSSAFCPEKSMVDLWDDAIKQYVLDHQAGRAHTLADWLVRR